MVGFLRRNLWVFRVSFTQAIPAIKTFSGHGQKLKLWDINCKMKMKRTHREL